MRRYRKNPARDLVETLTDAARILGVPTSATKEEVQRAYRQRARESHPDVGGSEEAIKLVNSAKEFFDKHFAQPSRGAEDLGSFFRRRQKVAHERATARVDRPYYGGEVNWPSVIPNWPETVRSPVVGIRTDGAVDLLVNNTYITTLSSLLGVVDHLKNLIMVQPGTRPGDWEGYITYIARQGDGSLTTMTLRDLWTQVMVGGVETRVHAPDLKSAKRMDPDDFS